MASDGIVRIANCSGFLGDRLSAAREMVLGGPIDVLTGDYLAELTMLILWKARAKDPSTGYASTFLRQMEEVLGTCMERKIRVVVNAGGLNPAGLAERLRALAERIGVRARIAHIEGDDLLPRSQSSVQAASVSSISTPDEASTRPARHPSPRTRISAASASHARSRKEPTW